MVGEHKRLTSSVDSENRMLTSDHEMIRLDSNFENRTSNGSRNFWQVYRRRFTS